jgi:hypothetical protein
VEEIFTRLKDGENLTGTEPNQEKENILYCMAFNKEHSMFNFNRLSPERFALLAAFLVCFTDNNIG